MESIVRTRVTPHFILKIDGEDGTPVREWKLCFDYRSIALIEEVTGLDLKKIEAWKDISSGKQFPQIVHGGLHRYNPEITLEQVLDILNPEAEVALKDVIFGLMFPGAAAALKKYQAAEKETAGATAVPNVPVTA